MSVIHAFTTNPEEITRESDIVISAAGVANLVRGSWLKQGAVVIDVGTNPIEVTIILFLVLLIEKLGLSCLQQYDCYHILLIVSKLMMQRLLSSRASDYSCKFVY